MISQMEAYRLRLERNHIALKKLADDVIKLDPSIEVYIHTECNDNLELGKYPQKLYSGIEFFKGELSTHVSFHEVPYGWSGCGFSEFPESERHPGKENISMPFTVQDVMFNLKPKHFHSKYYKDKEGYLKFHSWKKRYIPKNNG